MLGTSLPYTQTGFIVTISFNFQSIYKLHSKNAKLTLNQLLNGPQTLRNCVKINRFLTDSWP